ncbi:hypothetical protein [Arthrobacter sp. YAF34]|jgi:hypothetical protein|uniref:hypothetical protein n=1 Tax=Arthrobacter sp. YAF34 TaxID=3233083 RepID=UPI003F8F6451
MQYFINEPMPRIARHDEASGVTEVYNSAKKAWVVSDTVYGDILMSGEWDLSTKAEADDAVTRRDANT